LPIFSAISRKISLPVSAHECAASAIIEADPVRKPAAVFAAASRPLAISAMMTVRVDSPPLVWSSGTCTGTGPEASWLVVSWVVTHEVYPLRAVLTPARPAGGVRHVACQAGGVR
jgi:hypothetical protein